MTLLAGLFLLAASGRVELVDQVFDIPAAVWRYVDEIALKQTPVLLDCDFESLTRGPGLRVALLSRADLDRLRGGHPHGFIAASPPLPQGRLEYLVRTPGEYAIVVDNRDGPAVQVRLRVSLDFSSRGETQVRYLSRDRQLAVIVISFAVFFGIVFYSARRLLRAIRS